MLCKLLIFSMCIFGLCCVQENFRSVIVPLDRNFDGASSMYVVC